MRKLLTRPIRKLSIKFVIVLMIIFIFAFGYIFRRNILIAYHELGEKLSIRAILRLENSNQDQLVKQYYDTYDEHRNALLELGIYEERTFELKYLSIRSPEIRTMLDEFDKIHSMGSYHTYRIQGDGKVIMINDRTKYMPTWESLIKKYDVPPEEPNQPINSD